MYEKEKEKRKGGRRRRDWGLILLLVASATMFGIDFYNQVIVPQPPAAPFSLVTFDVNEAQDQIALSWSNGSTGVWATRKWNDVQLGAKTITNLLGGMDQEDVIALAYQPGGKALMGVSVSRSGPARSMGQLRVSDTQVVTLPDASAVQYSPQGQWLIVSYGQRFSVFQTTRPNQAYNPLRPDHTITVESLEVLAFDVSPDETHLVVAGHNNNDQVAVQLLTLPEGSLSRAITLSGQGPVTVAVHPDGRHIAVGSLRAIEKIDLGTGATRTIDFPLSSIEQLDYDPTGRWLVVRGFSASTTTGEGSVYAYDLASEIVPSPSGLATSSKAVKFQFLDGGILVGEASTQLTLFHWNQEEDIWKTTWVSLAPWEN